MSELTQEITPEEIIIPSFFLTGFKIYLHRFFYFVIVGILPFIALVLTSVSEYSIKNAGVAAWMQDSTIFSVFQFLIFAIRFFSFGAMIAAWTWLTGDIIFGEANSSIPSISDAVTIAWKRATRTFFSTFFVWMLITIYAQFAIFICKAVWVLFLPAGYGAASSVLLLTISWGILPVAALIGKFIFAVPLVVFEEMPSLLAVSFSSKLVPFKFVVWKWPFILLCGVILILTIVIPSWTYIDSFINVISGAIASPIHNLKIQIAGAAWMLITGPLAISILTSFYFMNSPRYWTEEINEKKSDNND